MNPNETSILFAVAILSTYRPVPSARFLNKATASLLGAGLAIAGAYVWHKSTAPIPPPGIAPTSV